VILVFKFSMFIFSHLDAVYCLFNKKSIARPSFSILFLFSGTLWCSTIILDPPRLFPSIPSLPLVYCFCSTVKLTRFPPFRPSVFSPYCVELIRQTSPLVSSPSLFSSEDQRPATRPVALCRSFLPLPLEIRSTLSFD